MGKQSRMDNACNTYAENKSYRSLVENAKGRIDLGKHGNWSILILKWILE
jgi:hypothetical protein